MVGVAPTEPLVYDNRVYLGSDSKRFLCLRAQTGVEEWHWEIGTRIIGPAAADADRVYFTAMDNQLRALSRGNGGQRWKYALAYRPTRGPAVMGDQVAVPGITRELPGCGRVDRQADRQADVSGAARRRSVVHRAGRTGRQRGGRRDHRRPDQ